MLGALAAVPIKVPQVSSLHRLAGQAPTVIPQVRPKTQIPDSLPHTPCQELQPLSLQKATTVSGPKGLGPALPTANCTFSPEHRSNGSQGDVQKAAPAPAKAQDLSSGSQESSGGPPQAGPVGPGVACALITTPSARSPVVAVTGASNGVPAVGEAVKVQPLLFSTDSKVIILQPKAPSTSPGAQANTPSLGKIAFMVALGLVTTDYLEELQTKRQERKRRSTANPAYSGLFEPERKRLASNYLNNPLFMSQDTEELCWKEDLEHDEHCSVCKEEGELQPCHNCTRAYHPDCLQPPLRTPPRGAWYCPKCQKKVLNKENMSWPQNFVQSYVTHKTVRQEEKRRLLRRNVELKKECAHLEEQDKMLNTSLERCMDVRERLLGQQRNTQASLERVKALIRLIQRDQVIQVTMTATTTAEASLLSLPWIKPASTATSTAAATAIASIPVGPSALLQRGQPQAQGNN
ncbi:hypothetical protein NHX12_020686 [Muraenolepis orangiensis]|uniref:PHD-type domain-containing protein n=1 Tax=Muraenolepis orangiensis TaxID=630683 RepID=A0A9Q0EVC2_9TELE|nr:hypothetical protein NHX12_020686 [Muraenolepis orangiensis]